MILPHPRLNTTVSVRLRAVALEAVIPELSHIPPLIGIAVHALPVALPALIHLAFIPGPTTILLDLDLRGRSAHNTSHQPLPRTVLASTFV